MIYNFFDKKSASSAVTRAWAETSAMWNKSGIENEIVSNKELAELQKPNIRKFVKRKVHSSFKDNIWGVDLAHMQLISKFKRRIRFLLCFIDICNKYAWVILLKDKKDVKVTNSF